MQYQVLPFYRPPWPRWCCLFLAGRTIFHIKFFIGSVGWHLAFVGPVFAVDRPPSPGRPPICGGPPIPESPGRPPICGGPPIPESPGRPPIGGGGILFIPGSPPRGGGGILPIPGSPPMGGGGMFPSPKLGWHRGHTHTLETSWGWRWHVS